MQLETVENNLEWQISAKPWRVCGTQMQIANRTSETHVSAIIHPEYLDGTCT